MPDRWGVHAGGGIAVGVHNEVAGANLAIFHRGGGFGRRTGCCGCGSVAALGDQSQSALDFGREAVATTTSAMPHWELTTVKPPSVSTSTIGVDRPEAWMRRHKVLAVARSSRASRNRMVFSGIFTKLAASIGSTRTR